MLGGAGTFNGDLKIFLFDVLRIKKKLPWVIWENQAKRRFSVKRLLVAPSETRVKAS